MIEDRATKTLFEHVAEKANTFSKSVERIMDDFSTLFLEVDMPISLPESIPDKAGDIENLLLVLDQKGKEIEALRDAYQKVLDDILKKIGQTQGFFMLKSELDSARQAYVALVRTNKELEDCVSNYNNSLEKLESTKLSEAGFDSKKSVEQTQSSLRKQRWALDRKFLGFGALVNRDKIKSLDKKDNELDKLRWSSFSEKYFNDSTFTYKNTLEAIGISAIDMIDSMCQGFKKETEKDLQKTNESFDPALIEELNQSYIDTVMRKELAHNISDSRQYTNRFNVIRDWGMAKDHKRALDLFKQTFEFDMNDWSETGDESEQKARTETKKRLRSEINGLPNSLRSFVQSRIQSTRMNDYWIKMNNDIKHLSPVLGWQRNYVESLSKAKNSLPKIGNHSLYSLSSTVDDKIRRNYDPRHLSVTELFDPKRWHIYRSNEHVRQAFGDQTLNEYENEISGEMLENLESTEDDKVSFTMASKLFGLGRKDVASYLTLNAFRVGKDHGRYPFIEAGVQKTGDSVLCKYFETFTDEDIERLRDENPELVDVIKIVRNNKDNFNIKTLRNVRGEGYLEGKAPRNPAYDAIQTKLEELSCRLLDTGNDKDRTFVLHTIMESERPLGKQAKSIRGLLQNEKQNYPVARLVEKVLFKRFQNKQDVESLIIMIQNETFSDDQKEEIIRAFGYGWDDYRSLGNKVSADDIVTISPAIKDTIEKMSKSTEPDKKFCAFLAAQNLDLPITPTSEDIIDLYGNKGKLTGNSSTEKLFNLGKNLTYTEDQGRHFVDILAKESITSRFLSGNHEKSLAELVAQFPTGDLLTIADKSSILWTIGIENVQELVMKSGGRCTPENWPTVLSLYISVAGGVLNFSEEIRKQITEMFSNAHPENRNFCLSQLQNLWHEYLAGTDDRKLSVRASIVAKATKEADGAGDLKYIEGIASFMGALEKLKGLKKTAGWTKDSIYEGLKSQEDRFAKEHWSEDDKTAFYNISQNILEAAPSLYTDFLDVFKMMDGKELKEFSKKYYPLYQVNLIVLQGEQGTYNARELVPVRNRLEVLKESLGKDGLENNAEKSKILEQEEKNLIETLQKNIERRFGLKKIPEVITPEHIRFMQDSARYLANINHRDPKKELLIGFYLGLNLNNEWEKFRSGQDIDPSLYFDTEKASVLALILKERKSLNEKSFDSLGLDINNVALFKERLQEETVSQTIGNIQTVDVKLGNAKRNLDELADPDLYPDQAEKAVLNLLKENSKRVGVTLAKTYSESIGKTAVFSSEELAVQSRLKEIYEVGDWTPAKVKELQDKVQLPNLILGMIKKLEDEHIDENISKLQELLKPSEEIITIFNSFGEEFKPSSGAMALSQDLTYLENIIVKNEQKIGPGNMKLVKAYLESVHAQMVILESLYGKAKEYFEKIKKSTHVSRNPLLKDRLTEVEKALYQTSEAIPITTRITNNMSIIIENMRQCLGCLRKEVNNDTNMTFGDANKFYIVSQGEKEKGSIADQITFLVPVETSQNGSEMSFVIDRLYGAKSADILVSHMTAIIKKYSGLKKEFPFAKLSVFVTNAALGSAGMSLEQMQEKILSAKESEKGIHFNVIDSMKVTIPPSALGDNYIEFGGAVREAGERTVSGLKITT